MQSKMNKSKSLLISICGISIAGGMLAYKVRNDQVLFYSTVDSSHNDVCYTVHALTTTTATTNTVSVPAGAIGWYVVDDCSGPTFKARTTNN